MHHATARRPGLTFRWPGLVLAVLALVSQLALGAIVVPDRAVAGPRAALNAMSVMCRGGERHQPVHHQHTTDPALCPLSVALALPSVVPLATPVVPVPLRVAVRYDWAVPAARGPPSRPVRIAYARGPPTLI